MWPFDMDEEENNTPMPPVAPDASPSMAPADVAAPMNPQVKDYLLQKYSPQNRQAIEAENKEDASGPNWLAGIAALGAGLQGQNAAAAGQNFLHMQNQQRQGKLDAFDKNRTLAMQDVNDKEMLAKRERENDPNSTESKLAQKLVVDMGIKPELIAGMSAGQLKSYSPAIQKRYEFQEKQLDRKDNREDRMAMLGIRREDQNLARQDRLERQDAALAEKQQGLKTPFGLANTVDDAKQLKEAHESKKNFDNKIQEMIALREKHGGGAIMNREDVARGKQLSKDLLLEYKNMAKLGVLSKSDEDIINAIIPEDPLQYNGPIGLVGQDPTLHRLKKFKEDSDKDFSTRVATRTRDGENNPALAEMKNKGKKVVRQMVSRSTGKTKLVYDDGTEEIVNGSVASNGR
jgi:hypothetical protein